MNAKSLLFGTLAGTVVLSALGFLVYGVLMTGLYETYTFNTTMRSDPDMLFVTLSTVVYAFVLTYIFTRWAGIRTVVSGATAGAVLGLLITLSVDLSMYAMWEGLSLVLVAIDPIAGAVWSAGGGAAIGYALSRLD